MGSPAVITDATFCSGRGSCLHHNISVRAVERLLACSVKRKMAQVKKMIVWLIPALWLAAGIDCLSETVGRIPHCPTCPALSSHQCGNRESSTSFFSIEQSARRLSRRLDLESGPQKLFSPVALFYRCHLLSLQPAFSSAHFQPLLGLAQSWQFLWRTAVEPRAPSSVS